MTLLAPMSAAIAGAIAVPLLIAMYVLKLRRRRVRVSSTMLWERAVEDLQVNEPFRRLRITALLILQLLALACLVVAIGRPAVPGSALAGDRVLLMIDASASMSAQDAPSGGTRLDDAKARAIELIRDLPRGAAVQVGVFAAEPVTLTGMTTDHAQAIRAVRTIEPTDQPAAMQPLTELASALLATPSESDQNDAATATLVLVSDGGLESGSGSLAGPPPRLIRVGPSNDTPVENAGIVAAAARRDYEDPSLVRVFVRVEQTLPRNLTLPLVTELDGRVNDRRTITIPAADENGPGSQTVTIAVTPADARLLSVRIDRADALITDNRVDLLLPERDTAGVLLVSPGVDPATGQSDPVAWVVGDIVEAIAGPGLVRTTLAGLRVRLAEENGFAGIDVVVLDRVGDPGALQVPSLSFAVPLPGIAIETPDSVGSTDVFINWRRAHPVLRGLAFDNVTISGPAWFLGADIAGAVSLARGRFGPIIVDMVDGLHRRIGVAFEPARSTWPLEISFTLFVAQALEVLSQQGEGEAGRSFQTNDPISLRFDSGETPVLLGPATLIGRIISDPGAGSVRAVFMIPPRVGVYADGTGRLRAAVNLLDPLESSIAVRDSVTIGGRSARASGSGEGRQEVWHWFVLGAFALLTIEWIWFSLRAGV